MKLSSDADLTRAAVLSSLMVAHLYVGGSQRISSEKIRRDRQTSLTRDGTPRLS